MDAIIFRCCGEIQKAVLSIYPTPLEHTERNTVRLYFVDKARPIKCSLLGCRIEG